MTLEDFAIWTAYFKLQLMPVADDDSFLDEWRKPLEPYTLIEAKTAVLVVNANLDKFSTKPKLFLPKIMDAIKAARRVKIMRDQTEKNINRPLPPKNGISFAEFGRRLRGGQGKPVAEIIDEYKREIAG